MQVGIFDSGIGGAEFGRVLQEVHPDLHITIVHDNKNMPYGSKTPKSIEKLVDAAIQPLLDYDVIVIACNTATAYAIDFLRAKYPKQKFIGFEPALKVARAKTSTDKIAVLATPATLASSRYLGLKQAYGDGLTVYEPDLSTLAHQIELNSVSWISLEKKIKTLVNQGVDTLVLGCTHYHLIEKEIQNFAGKDVTIITPTTAVIKQIEKHLY